MFGSNKRKERIPKEPLRRPNAPQDHCGKWAKFGVYRAEISGICMCEFAYDRVTSVSSFCESRCFRLDADNRLVVDCRRAPAALNDLLLVLILTDNTSWIRDSYVFHQQDPEVA